MELLERARVEATDAVRCIPDETEESSCVLRLAPFDRVVYSLSGFGARQSNHTYLAVKRGANVARSRRLHKPELAFKHSFESGERPPRPTIGIPALLHNSIKLHRTARHMES